jgi:hypothetical protein
MGGDPLRGWYGLMRHSLTQERAHKCAEHDFVLGANLARAAERTRGPRRPVELVDRKGLAVLEHNSEVLAPLDETQRAVVAPDDTMEG